MVVLGRACSFGFGSHVLQRCPTPDSGRCCPHRSSFAKWQCNDVESQDDDETFDADVLEDGAADS